ncbi:MAG: hypothetical protein CR997_09260 [Acidobacteria bacterium]|nr:MAG: hypothetical protein CR997_09260 [Acidobacteriota bacterium]
MPGHDGSGPMGRGARTGRGLGTCNHHSTSKHRAGVCRGRGRGLGHRGQEMPLSRASLQDRVNELELQLKEAKEALQAKEIPEVDQQAKVEE